MGASNKEPRVSDISGAGICYAKIRRCNRSNGSVFYTEYDHIALTSMILRTSASIQRCSTSTPPLYIPRAIAIRHATLNHVCAPAVQRRAISATRSIRKTSEVTKQRKRDDSSSFKGKPSGTESRSELMARSAHAVPVPSGQRHIEAGFPSTNHHWAFTAFMDRLEDV